MNSNASNNWIIPKVPVECNKLIPIYIYCIILFVTALASNLLLIKILMKNKDLMNPINFLALSLAIMNLLGALFEMPFVTVSAILCK